MANKIYKTSQGKEIDLGKLMMQNEEVRAVGNMKVNARGDAIDSGNKKVSDRNKQVSKNYRKQIGNVVRDMPVVNSQKAAKIVAAKYVESSITPTEVVGLDTEVVDTTPVVEDVTPEVVDTTPEVKETGGLAAAIAKAREVKQEPLKSPREEERGGNGVKKI